MMVDSTQAVRKSRPSEPDQESGTRVLTALDVQHDSTLILGTKPAFSRECETGDAGQKRWRNYCSKRHLQKLGSAQRMFKR